MRRGTARRGGGRGRGGNHPAQNDVVWNRLGTNSRVHTNRISTVNIRDNQKRYRYVKSPTQSTVSLPTEKRVSDLRKKFITSYYKMFDQPNRQDLVSLYSEDAFFSISSTHPMPVIHFGRNLLVVREPEPRISMLFVGRPKVAEVLATLAPTEHYVDKFTVDIPYYMATPMGVSSLQLVITGTFKDTSPQPPGQPVDPLRAFTRIFALKHVTTDTNGEPVYQIFNDMFMIQEATQAQVKEYLTSRGERTREAKVVSIMTRTNMTKQASTKLLIDADYDEERAMQMFSTLSAQNKIPQDFFKK